MRVRFTLVLIASAFAVQAAAQPAMPSRKPGLWKQTIASSRAGKAQPPLVSTICMDPTVDKAMSVFGQNAGQSACSSNAVSRTPTGYKFGSVCKMGGAGTITSQGAASGDFNTNYKVVMNSVTTGASMAAMNGASSTTITATWAGACPAGTKPGDMTMPGGIKINMLSAMARVPR
jgi:hypothetical protein